MSSPVQEYLENLEDPQRTTLLEVRESILQIIPEAEEVISYGFPGFKLQGKVICGMDAFKNHCSFFPHSSLVIPALHEDLKDYVTSKGTLRFAIDQPLPKGLIKKLIGVRLEQLGLKI
jgi:uncharacterized protein YdhG (YjbR/CyaY superfamily)